jgi:F0F1-type ATP synthase assembly protein I
LEDKQTNSQSPGEEGRPRRSSSARQFGAVMELPFHLVGAVIVGGLFGFFLDRWLGTAPILMIVLGGFGFYAGLREIWRRLKDGTGTGKRS